MVATLFLGLGIFSGCITENFDQGKINYCADDSIIMIYNNGEVVKIN